MDYVEEIISYDENAITEIEGAVAVLDVQAAVLTGLRTDRNYSVQCLKQAQSQLYAKIQQRIAEIEGYQENNVAIYKEVQRLTVESMELPDRINGKDYKGTMDPAEIYQKYVVNTDEADRNPLGTQIVAHTLQYNGGIRVGRRITGGRLRLFGHDVLCLRPVRLLHLPYCQYAIQI